MHDPDLSAIIAGIHTGDVIPYLGPGALDGARDPVTGAPIPADGESLILAMNNGHPMAPRLMYEFPRAAMNQELRRGRSFVNRFLADLYSREWTLAPLHDWLGRIRPPYVIDINRDTQLQEVYRNTPHILVVGISRIGGTAYRFRVFMHEDTEYREIDQDAADPDLPVLFKPMGTPLPEPTFIASDADYVDYLTELMGGFAIPAFLKRYRRNRRYLFLGLRLTRDTERMVSADITYDAGTPRGWALIPEPTEKERRFCARRDIEIIQADSATLLRACGAAEPPEPAVPIAAVGC